MLTREFLEKRLQGLKNGLAKAITDRDELNRTICCYDGAIQECEWAIEQLSTQDIENVDFGPGLEVVDVNLDDSATSIGHTLDTKA